MRRTCLTVFVAITVHSADAQAPCDVFCHSRLADRAEKAHKYDEFLAHARVVAELAPSHPGAVYAMARGFALVGDADSAVTWLARLGRMGDARDPNADSAFRSVRTRPGYTDARNRLLSNRLPILDGKVAFEIQDADYLPEALDYDAARERFLIGSLSHRSVAAFTPNGQASPLVAHTPEMYRVVGVHVDAPRNRLWFATWGPDSAAHVDSTSELPSVTRLFLADLATGRVVKSWAPDGGRGSHLLNDFVVMDDGTLYITDTERGWIYRLHTPGDSLEIFLQPDSVRYAVANGITSAPGSRVLYVAFLQGIARVDIDTRAISVLPAPDSVSTASIDGLYWYRGSLIGVQGIPTLSRVVRYTLSADGKSITAGGVLERGPTVVVQPTTGTIVGSRFYYIANSQYGRLDDRTSAVAPQKGAPVRTAIRVIELRP